MKKILAFVVFLVSVVYMSSVSASVDLQPRSVFYVSENDTNVINMDPGFYVSIQNNGPDDFQGTFTISYLYDGMGVETPAYVYHGTIESGMYKNVRISSQENIFFVKIDSKNEISETNEDNNNYYLRAKDFQVRVSSSWTGVIAENYYETLFVLPNEYFFQQFSLAEMNERKLRRSEGSIIGFDYYSYAYGFTGQEEYCSEVQSFWPEGAYVDGNLVGGKYAYYFNPASDKYNTSCQWMANTSNAALDYFYLGCFYGVARGMPVGSEAKIYINTTIALRDLTRKSDGFVKTIKVIDRIRGDVNDDGIVDQADLDILNDVVNHGLYNPCMSFKNMYQERGMNYGAGIIMFSTPDFLSNCLINIWLHDKNDPLVQGLGIGELMSKTSLSIPNSPIYGVKNNFSISGEDLNIIAPDADLYNVTAQTSDGKLFQVTGKISDKVKVPIGATNVRVETVKVKQNLTALASPKNSINVSIYPTKILDYVNVKYTGNGKVQVVDLSGRIIFSSPLKTGEELKIETSAWSNGVYVINVISETGVKSTKVVK